VTFDHPPRVGHVATVGAVGGFVGYLAIHMPGPDPRRAALKRARVAGAACLVGAIASEMAGIKPAGTVLAGLGGMFTVAGQAQLFRNVRDDNSTSARPSLYTSPATHPAMTPGIAG